MIAATVTCIANAQSDIEAPQSCQALVETGTVWFIANSGLPHSMRRRWGAPPFGGEATLCDKTDLLE